MFSVPSSTLGGTGVSEVCPQISSNKPDVFGPATWWALHTFAQNYPDLADSEHRLACENFVGSLPHMLPCSHCGHHFKDFIEQYTSRSGSMCEGRLKLADFMCQSHNNVNAGTGKPLYSCCPARLRAQYSSQSLCVPGLN